MKNSCYFSFTILSKNMQNAFMTPKLYYFCSNSQCFLGFRNLQLYVLFYHKSYICGARIKLNSEFFPKFLFQKMLSITYQNKIVNPVKILKSSVVRNHNNNRATRAWTFLPLCVRYIGYYSQKNLRYIESLIRINIIKRKQSPWSDIL